MDKFLSNCRNSISFYVNCKQVKVENPNPEINLLYFLRKTLRLTGTKQGCNEGGCGACTVMISKYDPIEDEIKHFSVTACLIPICSLDGVAITTIEGIGSTRNKLHPCQESIGRCHGTQCGFCTPGMVMSMYTLLRNNSQPTEQEMEASLRVQVVGAYDDVHHCNVVIDTSGYYFDATLNHPCSSNLCRCTGYRSILDSFRPFCKDCSCKAMQQEEDQSNTETLNNSSSILDGNVFIDDTQEPIFPPELKVYSSMDSSPVHSRGPRISWYQPITLEQVLLLREKFPWDETNANRIVAGNASIKHCQVSVVHPDVLISVNSVPELKEISLTDDGLVVGAAVTMSELEACLLKTVQESSDDTKTRVFKVFLEMLNVFGSPQTKNTVTIGGVIIANGPISDVNPILVASQSKVVIASKICRRELTLTTSDKPLLEPNEVLVSVYLPYSKENEYISFYKQSRRKYMDPAIVNTCMWVKLEGSVVRDCRLVFGNMGVNLVMASDTLNAIVNKEWNDDTLSIAVKTLSEEMTLPSHIEGGMATYRTSLCLSLFYKFYLYVKSQISTNVSYEDNSAITPLPCGPSKGSRGFQSTPSSQPLWDSIGRPLMHLSAMEQATGEAKYVDDIPATEGELFAGFVLSSCAHGTFTLDTSPLDRIESIRGFVSVEDVPGSNRTGLCNDENLFADGEVTAMGQIIGIVVAEDMLTAQIGAKSVIVTYKELPTVLTIDEAISAGQFFQPERELVCGNFNDAFDSSEHKLEGEMRVGGQEHFYMETCSCLCIPKGEKGEIEIISSTQDLAGVQKYSSIALNVPANKIVAKVKRIGGGFGGKELRCDFPYAAVAVAANKLQTPVRAVLERTEDMINTGGRCPFKAFYKVGFDGRGVVEALDVDLYSNAGYSADLSPAVIDAAILRLQSVYNIVNMRIRGHACKTNLPSNTAMRGFGMAQALMIMETIITRIADTLGLDTNRVQEANLLKDGDKLLYGLEVEDCTIRRCWSTLKEKCDFEGKKKAIQKFNVTNKWKKRGIALVPTLYGMGIEFIPLNQAGALVHVYTDGSVLLTHGGVEMGQGLHTKMVQVCSKCLSIPVDRIHLNDTSTDKVPNATPTAASTSSDLYGMAVKDACDQINERLKSFKDSDPQGGWNAWVIKAYLSRVNLSAQGFYKTPDVWMDWDKGTGRPFAYYSYGVGCSVVEVDTLTGSFQVLSTDLLMDVGNSLNPALDIGQIEGAFTQGLGLYTMEENVFLRNGEMFSVGPKLYKIPGCSDIPIELNVTLLDRCPNSKAIFSSKGIGEPPLFLAASVFFAIKNAIKHARSDRGLTGSFDLWSPATTERIRLACEDQFVKMVKEPDNFGNTWDLSVC